MTGKIKVFVLRPREEWIVDTIAQDFAARTSHTIVSHPADADVVWLLGSWCWDQIASYLPGRTVLCTVHHVVPGKFDEHQFRRRDPFVSTYLVYTTETARFISNFTSKPIVLVHHWVDTSRWYPVDKSQARSRIGIASDQFVVGSFQRDTEGRDLISPKLEKGPDIFCDVVERISSTRPITVLLGGWRREYVIGRLRKAGVSHVFLQLPPQETVRDMYASCDFYLCTSRIEGGPQCVLEAAAMRVPIFSTPVGIAPDVLHPRQIIDPATWSPIDLNQGEVQHSYNQAACRTPEILVPKYDQIILSSFVQRA
jgi:glycosyltransferase involved in cell wall biosynthesis